MKATLASALCGLIACSTLAASPAWAQPDSPAAQGYVESAPGQVFLGGGGPAVPVPFGPLMIFDRSFGEAPGYDADFTNVRMFLPWHVVPGTSLTFASIGGSVTDQGDFVANLGGGYRQYVSDWDRIYGTSFWYDIDDGHADTYSRVGVSLETLGRYFDVRANGYLLVGQDSTTLFNNLVGDPFFRANQILLSRRRILESAYGGVDGEVGGLLPLIGRYGFYGYVGGYYLDADQDESTVGVSVHLQSQITDDVTFDTRYTEDSLFGSNVWFNVALTLPDGRPATWFTPKTVQQRLSDPVSRLMRIPTNISDRTRGQELVNVKDNRPFFVLHVDPTRDGGDGTFENPFGSLEQARQANNPGVDIIRVLPNPNGSGADLAVNAPFVLFDTQRLLSTSVEHTIDTTVGTLPFPGFTGGPNPFITLTLATPSSVVVMGNHTEVSGFTISGSGIHNPILASNVRDFDINRNLLINGPNGILVTASDGRTTQGVIRQNTIGGNSSYGVRADVTNNSTLDLDLIANRFGVFAGAQNGISHFLLTQDSGLSQTLFESNFFGFIPSTAVDFQLTGTGQAEVNAFNNIFGAAALADLIRAGFNSGSLPANDDGSTGLIPIGFLANFFGLNFTDVFVNNNGNVTFNNPLGTFTPFPILTTGVPIIAPFFADVDTRQGNIVTFGQGTVNGRPAFGVNWIDVRHFSAVGGPNAGLPTNSFQLVLIDRSDINPGDFDIEFNYDRILWEAGQASGSNPQGLGGSTARVGYSNGINTSFELPGSAVPGALLDSGPPSTSLVQNSLNSGVLGRYIFQARSGQVLRATGGDGIRITALDSAVVLPSRFENNVFQNSGGNAINVQTANAALVQALTIVNNRMTTSGFNGLNFEARDTSRMASILAQGNTITGSGANGVFARVEDSAVFGSLVFDANTISANSGSGLRFELADTGVMNPVLTRNTINSNGADGVTVQAEDVVVTDVVLTGNQINGNVESGVHVSVTDSAVATTNLTGNEISNNGEAGFALRTQLTTRVAGAIQGNRITGNVDGIFIDRRDLSFIDGLIIGNRVGQTGLGNVITGNTESGIDIDGRGSANVVNRIRVAGNTVDSNGDGMTIDLAADAIFVVGAFNNSFSQNATDGVRVTTANNSSFGNPLVLNDPSQFDGNLFLDNGDEGIELIAVDPPDPNLNTPNRSFHNVVISGDSARTVITGGQNGIAVTYDSTLPATLGGIVGSQYRIRGTDISGVGADGINFTTTTGTTTTTIGGQGAGEYVTVTGSGDDGLDFAYTDNNHTLSILGDFTAPVGQRTVIANNGATTGAGNTDATRGDGITINHTSGDLDVTIYGAYVERNAGRGLTIDDRAFFDTGAYEIGDIAAQNANSFSSNGQQGIVVATVSPPVIPLTAASFRDNFAFNPPFGDFYNDFGSPDFVETFVLIENNNIQFNGQLAQADGLVFLVGTNTYLHADVNGNRFGGNTLDDVFITPIRSFDPAQSIDRVQPGTPPAPPPFDELQFDPVAHLDLAFGVISTANPDRDDPTFGETVVFNAARGNTGDRIRVSEIGSATPVAGTTLAGIFLNADPFKPANRPVNGEFQVHSLGLLDPPTPNANVFIQQGVQQNIQGTFAGAGFEIVPPGNLFPDPAQP